MELQYNREYASIKEFSPYTLPDFVLITGVNGSGKTHLLKAIEQDFIRVDSITRARQEVIYYDWNTLVPNVPQAVNIANLPDISQTFENTRQFRVALEQQISHICNRYHVSKEQEKQIIETLEVPAIEMENFSRFSKDINGQIQNSAVQIRSNLSAISSIDGLDDRTIIKLDQNSTKNLPITFKSGQSLFQHSFSLIFLRYYELVRDNKLSRLDFDDGDSTSSYLSDADFIARHGRPPWEIVNNILNSANLDFQITFPIGNTVKTFVPKLIKKSTGVEVKFQALSSGEKVLISFAFCIFHTADERNDLSKPKLILLDEVDATLHPAMSRQLVTIIRENIVKMEGIKVIMTTHSPSTVAIAPEDSIYLKKPDLSTLVKTSKSEAMNVLTEGIPSLAIDFSGRRQVFVESDSDAERYDALYQIYKSQLSSEISLAFIGAGARKKSGEHTGSGCAVVIKTVDNLRSADNSKIFGLIDWDCDQKRSDTKGVKVLGKDYWHSIENCLCDPLLIALFLLRKAPSYLSDRHNLSTEINYISLPNMEHIELQKVSNLIQSEVLKCKSDELTYDSIEFTYLGGFSINVSERYCQFRGHDLAEKIIDTFKPLESYREDPDRLLKLIIEQPITEHKQVIPTALLECYRKLLS
ncbi:AAA family ATPase [Shewanella sp. 125m-1]